VLWKSSRKGEALAELQGHLTVARARMKGERKLGGGGGGFLGGRGVWGVFFGGVGGVWWFCLGGGGVGGGRNDATAVF